eukprot:TRINITY_DN1767_c2_g1_i1.p2 TRINITY_DN1767_c2_g1~~TRINITY_DN1767_c2_g1_i1.p2  ORF type:complete len:390 (+),score=169.73 TRINITY_DN1767_c2_g1_i1:154-1170(+)
MHFGGGIDPDMMEQMFGGGGMGGMGGLEALFGGGMRGGGMRQRKGRDIGVRLGVSLEELYNGAEKEFELEKPDHCSACRGTGSKTGRSTKCSDCQGRGVKLMRRMIGPGMVQQMQAPCDTCGSSGKILSEKDKCRKCEGEGIIEAKKKFNVKVLPGMQHDDQIPFRGEGEVKPGVDIPGDLVFVLQRKEHDHYRVEGADLHMEKAVTLAEALTGFQFEHVHLDGEKHIFKSPSRTIVTPGKKMVLKGMGMRQRRGEPGDLIITFSLTFPRMLGEDQVATLQQALPATKPPVGSSPDAEECFMDDYTPEEWKAKGAIGEDEEEDAEEESGGGGIQCAHQ